MPHFFINSQQVNNNKISISRSGNSPRPLDFGREREEFQDEERVLEIRVREHRQNEENYFHIARSLRARTGERLLLIDENKIQYETTIESITNDEITAKIDKSYPSKRFLDFELFLAQSPLRSDAQNLLIEKATELGVKGIYPVKTDNCALNNEMIDKKIDKWQKIMYESSKQCERADIPTCYPRTTIEKVLNENCFDKVMVFCERIATKTIRQSFEQNPIKKEDKVLVIIGPEGGFSQKEFDSFKQLPRHLRERVGERGQIEMLTLGDMILRAETATTVALGNIIYEYSNH